LYNKAFTAKNMTMKKKLEKAKKDRLQKKLDVYMNLHTQVHEEDCECCRLSPVRFDEIRVPSSRFDTRNNSPISFNPDSG